MKTRQAKKIVRNQIIRCRSRMEGPEDIVTGGRKDYGRARYDKAMRLLLRKLDRERKDPKDGAIARIGKIHSQMNWARVQYLIDRDAA